MKALIFTAAMLTSFHSTLADTYEPSLVHAVVREFKLAPSSPPDDGKLIPGSPPVWEAFLVIDQVLRGPEDLKGKEMHTLTAASLSQGNARIVTPKLNVGDVGIWAIKQMVDGTLFEVYSPHEVEKGVPLPLIKGRHDAYAKILSQFSGTPGASLPHDADKGPSAQSLKKALKVIADGLHSLESEEGQTRAKRARSGNAAMESFLKTWNPIGKKPQDLRALFGEPREESDDFVLYAFDNGSYAWLYRFVIRNGTVVELTRPLSE